MIVLFWFFYTEKDRQKIVTISLKRSAPLYNRAALKFKLVFSAEFEILGALRKVLGDEKLMVSSNMWDFFLTIFHTGQNHSDLCDLCFVVSLFPLSLFTIYFFPLWIYDTPHGDVLSFGLKEKLDVLEKKFKVLKFMV